MRSDTRPVVVAIACSTGGPRALAALIPALPADLPAAVLVVQHMPVGFIPALAARIDARSSLRVAAAADGEPLRVGTVRIAPGGRHMTVVDAPVLSIALNDEPPVRGLRPCADLLLESVAVACGRRAVAVILAGMGRDGSAGLGRVRSAGGIGLVEDQHSATMGGMPRSALEAAGADAVVALEGMAQAIVAAVLQATGR